MTRTNVQFRAIAAALLFTIGLAAYAPASFAQWDASRSDSHAPIGVMGDHRHHKGELMISYRYMYMGMEGSRIGTDPIDDAQIVGADGEGFMVTPTEMPMQMHMVGAMYGVSERVTAMIMLPYRVISMDHITRAGGAFTTESSGFGDVKAGTMIGLADWSEQSLHVNALLSLPTGSIDEEDVLPNSGGAEVQLPYPMQVGSGTFDLMPALTWLGQYGDWSWGARSGATIRLGENDRDWSLGDVFSLTAWGSRNLHRHVSASVRLKGTTVGNIDGADSAPSVHPVAVPTARTDLRGGEILEAGFGLNLYIPKLNAFRIAVEGMVPLYRNLDGPQLERDWAVTVGLQVVPIR